ncbi:MAG: SsrA-binding protein SmpB [Cellvibrionaceae bacterium]|uniref:SsrA-binding protein SmpB n=1 Tax=uncultured Pseudoteredinibacter sp. TaxID=1641701 RepID=UPI00263A112B|nr:SsrA-binding protein SmpB [uncultured Pseudoteredinibacter sp.]MCV6624380.1 SsrA-binding protein SmpB [Cellvibrionaceae bacterium]
MAKKQKKTSPNTIAQNKRARFDYHISDTVEAGLELMGWEVKSLREGKGQLTDSYVFFKNGEAFLLNAQIQPLISASTHFVTEPTRSRRLLLHKKEIAKLRQAAEQQGYSVIALSLYWKNHLVKCQIGLGKGKQQHDKRETEKQRDWNRQKQRLMQTK